MSEKIISFEDVGSTEPLGRQFGAIEPATVPDDFFDHFFGAETSFNDVEEDQAPAMMTYAIVDAAKVPQFVQIIEASGLEHLCLFQGDAQDELEDVAPWIVRLENGNSFTRNLFSHDIKTPWFLAEKDTGLYFRSKNTLAELRGHFRKYTRVKDEDGKWYYFRFWEPRWTRRLLEEMSDQDLTRFLEPVEAVLIMSWSQAKQRLELSVLRKSEVQA